MRRVAFCLIIAVLAIPGAVERAASQPAAPPHAWLFGSWTGGLFPVSSSMTAEMCRAQPTVIFTRDVVLRASLIESSYTQRGVETARSTPAGTEFHFMPGASALGALDAGLLGRQPPPPQVGFGCENPDVLHVQRRGENEISFPGCRDFPEPLVRCP